MILKKSAISLAVAAGLAMTGTAQAGELILDLVGKVPTFATHIFGDGAGNGNDSSGQAIYAPDMIFEVGTPGVIMGNAAGTVEIRFNLGNGAVFDDAITEEHFSYLPFGGVFPADGLSNLDSDNAGAAAALFTILNGGQIGDFDVTVRLDMAVLGAAMATGDQVRLQMTTGATTAGVAAGADTTDPAQNVQYNNVLFMGTAGSIVQASVSIQNGEDPTDEETIAVSADPLVLEGFAAGNGGANEIANTINMSDADILFSTGTDGTADGVIDGSDSLEPGQEENILGSLRLIVTTASQDWDTASTAGLETNTLQISDPAGDQYAPDGADSVSLTITTNVADGLAALDTAGGLVLDTDGGNCASGADQAGIVTTDTAIFDYSALVNNTFKNLCGIADGVTAIQPQTFTATVQYENFEPTYRDDEYTATLAAWVRNGCTATFFNVTKNNNNDETYLRITNATAASAPVRVRVWGQDGSLLGTNGALLEASLGAHETKVYTPSDIQAAVGTGEWSGRARVVAFVGANSCVGQNLVRSGGININMTATTDANDGSYVDYSETDVANDGTTYGSSNSGN